eukprot:GSChrysophyteH1.ASY1.ANO1.1517.1 assembled CDS
MDSLRKVEEDLRNLAIEFRKKYPEVMDATERALTTLKTMREMYVADKMRKSGMAKEDVRIPQSSDIVAPYILACNYSDANPKLLLIALNGIQMLVSFEMIPPADVKNLLRVFSIQAATGKPELQLKILQMLLSLANLLAASEELANYLTESTLRGFFNLMLSMCSEGCSVSVSTTAVATLRQMTALVLDPLSSSDHTASSPPLSRELKEGFSKCALNLLGDLVRFARGGAAEWCRGVQIKQSAAFDLLDYVMLGWKDIFQDIPAFQTYTKESMFPMLKALMRNLQDDYAHLVGKDGVHAASVVASRVVRLARTFLLNLSSSAFLEETEIVTHLMIHALTSDFDFDQTAQSRSSESDRGSDSATSSMIGGAQALIGGLARFQMPFGVNKEKERPVVGEAALQAAYLSLSGPTMSSSQSTPDKPPSRLLVHPAGACLEALLSFFLLNTSSLLAMDGGKEVMVKAMMSTLQSACSVLTQTLTIEANVLDFEKATQESKLVVTLEAYLSGRETGAQQVARSVHETLSSSATSAAEMLILAFYTIQVVLRQLVEFALVSSSMGAKSEAMFYINEAAIPQLAALNVTSPTILSSLSTQVVEAAYEGVQEACSTILTTVSAPLVVRRGAGILSEIALVAGLLQMRRPCEAILSTLCRFTVPCWHGHAIAVPTSATGNALATPTKTGSTSHVLQWKHVQAVVRLTQTIHALANVISDWDPIIDAFEQVADCILDPKTAYTDDVTTAEIDSVLDCLERFKKYSVFMSDTALTKLMTSLVALSLNNLAVTARSTSTGSEADWRTARITDTTLSFSVRTLPPNAPNYMADGISAGLVSFSLQATVEIAKCNIHRSQCVWQMVTSHLKMVANLKSSVIRAVAVASTFDLISSMLAFLHSPLVPSMDNVDASKPTVNAVSTASLVCMSDEVIFTSVLPSFKAAFVPRRQHAELLLQAKLDLEKHDVTLSQADILSAAKVLAGIRYDDVRTSVMQGLLAMLQEGGEILSQDGWSCVLVLISLGPASLVPGDSTDNTDNTDNIDNTDSTDSTLEWQVEAVAASFNCMRLILDEYLDRVDMGSMTSVITCLSMFSSQPLDVNISLTSLELLWKVYDLTMRSRDAAAEDTKQEIFNITTTQLLGLSMDTRPEIRHCAINTLFAALTMTANASLTTGSQWKQIFDDVIFPLFAKAGARSTRAIESKEEANAPELKKGKKMTLHHSRDTAQKQWSETRVLALRGLARVVQTCAVILIQEDWFRETWKLALAVCKKATAAAVVDQEVALASFDVMFTMLKIVSEGSFAADSRDQGVGTDEHRQRCRNDMWLTTWTAVNDASKFNDQCPDVALHISQNLIYIYEGGENKEFAGTGNLRDVCDCIVTLSRPRVSRAEEEGKKGLVDMQLYRLLVKFINILTPKDAESMGIVGSAVIELCFANQYVQMPSYVGDRDKISMAPCPQKFRDDVANFFVNKFLDHVTPETMRTHGIMMLDTVFKRFITDICGLAISYRSDGAYQHEAATPVKASSNPTERASNRKALGFFAFLAGATDVDSDNNGEEEGSVPAPTDSVVAQEPPTPGPRQSDLDFHTLKQCPVPNKSGSRSWTSFYPLTTELNLLTTTLKKCLDETNFDVLDESIRENVFSTFLCFFSPWRTSELPGAKDSYGTYVEANHQLAPALLEALEVIYGVASAHPRSSWTVGLVSAIADAMQLQIHAVVDSDQQKEHSKEEGASMLSIWTRVCDILSVVAKTSEGVNSRRTAIESILKLARDLAYGVLMSNRKSNSKDLLQEGCIIFVRCLLQLETSMNDTPRTFSGRRSQENEILQSWLLNLTNPPVEELWEKPYSLEDAESFSKHGHLLIFLPIAFKLLQCDCEEIKDIIQIIIDMVDIAALISSYSDLRAQLDSTQIQSLKNPVLK